MTFGSFLIGYERQNHLKVAGVRTHLIVCLAAAMIMIVSKYGFNDILSHEGIAPDPSRSAAQIISGVSFLGAGIIFVHKREITGFTAAEIWAAAAVEMAIVAGMYVIGILATILILLVQIIFHKQYRWIPTVWESWLISKIQKIMHEYHIEIMNFKVSHNQSTIILELLVKLPTSFPLEDMLTLFDKNNDIISIEIK